MAFFFLLDSYFNCTGFLTANYQPSLSEAEKEHAVSLAVNTHHGAERGTFPWTKRTPLSFWKSLFVSFVGPQLDHVLLLAFETSSLVWIVTEKPS